MIYKNGKIVVTGYRWRVLRVRSGIAYFYNEFAIYTIAAFIADLKRNAIFTGEVSGRCINISAIRVNHQSATLIGGHRNGAGNRVATAITYKQIVIRLAAVIDQHIAANGLVYQRNVDVVFRQRWQIKYAQINSRDIGTAATIIN